MDHCQFVNGPEVFELEKQLAAYCGAKHVVACSNGTDALLMVMMAKNVGPGDAVLCPSFTFIATASPAARTGATPVYVDVDETTFNMSPESLKRGIAAARKAGLKPVAVIPVDLFGQPADHDAIAEIAKAEGLFVIDDAAQSFGASYKGRKLGTFGLATTTSFFPAKPLGCFGDGGAILTDDDELAATLRSIRVHGQGVDKYDNVRLGLTGRLDTMQAAILIEKLKIFDDEIAARNKVARALCAGPVQRRHRAAPQPRQYFGLGAIHHPPAQGHRPRRLCRRAEGPGRADRDLLRQVDAPADRLQAVSGRRRRAACLREPVAGRHQPADAPLSDRSRSGAGHRRRARRAFRLISLLF